MTQTTAVISYQAHAEVLSNRNLHCLIQATRRCATTSKADESFGEEQRLWRQLISPKHASSAAQTFTGFTRRHVRLRIMVSPTFWMAVVSSRSGLSWQGQPIFGFTVRHLKSWPMPSGCAYSTPWRSRRNFVGLKDHTDPALLHGRLRILDGAESDQLLATVRSLSLRYCSS